MPSSTRPGGHCISCFCGSIPLASISFSNIRIVSIGSYPRQSDSLPVTLIQFQRPAYWRKAQPTHRVSPTCCLQRPPKNRYRRRKAWRSPNALIHNRHDNEEPRQCMALRHRPLDLLLLTNWSTLFDIGFNTRAQARHIAACTHKMIASRFH